MVLRLLANKKTSMGSRDEPGLAFTVTRPGFVATDMIYDGGLILIRVLKILERFRVGFDLKMFCWLLAM